MDILSELFKMTALGVITCQTILMWAIAFVLLYLGIKKGYEPLLLIPIASGVLFANFPGVQMGIVDARLIQLDEHHYMNLFEIAHEYGIMNYLYYSLIKTGLLPPIIFLGVGVLTDFGPMLRNLKLALFGAAAQIGIFSILLGAIAVGFTPQEAASLGIIGRADGPTAIYTTIKLPPPLLGPIAIAAYSYMALVPIIVPLVANLLITKPEFKINMKAMDKQYPAKVQIKDLKTAKIIFPIAL